MKIVECFQQGKAGYPEKCEDGYVVTPDYAAVVDGSTSKLPPGQQALRPKSTGRQAMETTLEAIRALPPRATQEEAVQRLTEALRRTMPPEAAGRAECRPTCSAVLFSRYWGEVWFIGDCQCRYGGRTYAFPKAVDDILAGIRSDVIAYLLRRGRSVDQLLRHDEGREAIMDALRQQTYFQNDPNPYNPYRYTVLDGFPVLPGSVPTLRIGRTGRLVLASDGYPELCDTLAATEQRLADLLRDDPLCYRLHPSTKGLREGNCSFDDRTFLSIEL